MSRSARLLVPLTTIAVAAMLLAPNGAIGGERLTVRSGNGDRYRFGQDVVIEAPVHGSVQVYGGNIYVHHVIKGDLLVFGGNITVRDPGRIAGNVIYTGGNISGTEGRVGGRVYSLMTLQGAAATMRKSAVFASLLFAWFIVAVVLTLISGREIRFSSVELRVSALHCFALGLVAFTSFVLTAIVFSYLVPYLIGIPLLAALGVFAVFTKVYGMVAVFHAVGTLVAGARSRDQLASRKWLRGDLAMVAVGLLILGGIRLIPMAGTVVWSIASIFGVGVALATKFGRREPVFLAWTTAEA